jgi:ring-1,2-phenylacetyl-CoA epoxidase subunit PaaA
MTMPEERFHAQFGKDFCTELCRSADGRRKVQAAIDHYYPYLPAFFGRAGSKNNAQYRRWGIKQRTNEDMRADFVARARALVEDHLNLKLPPVPEAA